MYPLGLYTLACVHSYCADKKCSCCFPAGVRGSLEERGVIPNSFDHIFTHISRTHDEQYLVRASYLEIYQVAHMCDNWTLYMYMYDAAYLRPPE